MKLFRVLYDTFFTFLLIAKLRMKIFMGFASFGDTNILPSFFPLLCTKSNSWWSKLLCGLISVPCGWPRKTHDLTSHAASIADVLIRQQHRALK
jgi:hypothetical protein